MGELHEYAHLHSREVVEEIVLMGVSSGSKTTQDAIDSIIMRKCDRKDFDELVVTNLNRLTRKGAKDVHFLISVFAKHGIKLVTLDYPIATDDPCPYLVLDLSSDSPRLLKQRSSVNTQSSEENDKAKS